MYRLILIDMDGTLLNNDLKISDENIQSIHEATLQRKGVIIATGRSLSEMNPYMNDLKDVRYYILENGAVIFDNVKKEMIDQHYFQTDDVEKLIALSFKQDLMPHYFTGGYSYSFAEKMTHMDKYHMGKFQDFYLKNVRKIIDFDEFKRKYSHKIEKIIFYHQNINEMKLCHQFLKNIDIAKVDVGMSIELSPKGISKASGLMKLCQILKISMNEIIAVGDSDNDLDILNQVGLAIAVGNANENVKKICDQVVLDNDHHGVSQAIHTYLLESDS